MSVVSVEKWLENVLCLLLSSSSMGVDNPITSENTAMKIFAIDRESLAKSGVGKEAQDKLYKSFYVYSSGIHDAIRQATNSSHPDSKGIALKAWTIFTRLLEFCEPNTTEMIFQEMQCNQHEVIKKMRATYDEVLSTKQNECIELDKQLVMLRLRSESAESQLADLTLTHVAMTTSLRKTIFDLEQEIESTRKRDMLLAAEIKEIKKNNTKLFKEVTELSAETAQQKTDLEAASQAYTLAKAKISGLNNKVAQCESRMNQDEQTIEKLREQHQMQLTDRQNLFKQMSEQGQELRASKTLNAQLGEEVEKLTRQRAIWQETIFEPMQISVNTIVEQYWDLGAVYAEIYDDLTTISGGGLIGRPQPTGVMALTAGPQGGLLAGSGTGCSSSTNDAVDIEYNNSVTVKCPDIEEIPYIPLATLMTDRTNRAITASTVIEALSGTHQTERPSGNAVGGEISSSTSLHHRPRQHHPQMQRCVVGKCQHFEPLLEDCDNSDEGAVRKLYATLQSKEQREQREWAMMHRPLTACYQGEYFDQGEEMCCWVDRNRDLESTRAESVAKNAGEGETEGEAEMVSALTLETPAVTAPTPPSPIVAATSMVVAEDELISNSNNNNSLKLVRDAIVRNNTLFVEATRPVLTAQIQHLLDEHALLPRVQRDLRANCYSAKASDLQGSLWLEMYHELCERYNALLQDFQDVHKVGECTRDLLYRTQLEFGKFRQDAEAREEALRHHLAEREKELGTTIAEISKLCDKYAAENAILSSNKEFVSLQQRHATLMKLQDSTAEELQQLKHSSSATITELKDTVRALQLQMTAAQDSYDDESKTHTTKITSLQEQLATAQADLVTVIGYVETQKLLLYDLLGEFSTHHTVLRDLDEHLTQQRSAIDREVDRASSSNAFVPPGEEEGEREGEEERQSYGGNNNSNSSRAGSPDPSTSAVVAVKASRTSSPTSLSQTPTAGRSTDTRTETGSSVGSSTRAAVVSSPLTLTLRPGGVPEGLTLQAFNMPSYKTPVTCVVCINSDDGSGNDSGSSRPSGGITRKFNIAMFKRNLDNFLTKSSEAKRLLRQDMPRVVEWAQKWVNLAIDSSRLSRELYDFHSYFRRERLMIAHRFDAKVRQTRDSVEQQTKLKYQSIVQELMISLNKHKAVAATQKQQRLTQIALMQSKRAKREGLEASGTATGTGGLEEQSTEFSAEASTESVANLDLDIDMEQSEGRPDMKKNRSSSSVKSESARSLQQLHMLLAPTAPGGESYVETPLTARRKRPKGWSVSSASELQQQQEQLQEQGQQKHNPTDGWEEGTDSVAEDPPPPLGTDHYITGTTTKEVTSADTVPGTVPDTSTDQDIGLGEKQMSLVDQEVLLSAVLSVALEQEQEQEQEQKQEQEGVASRRRSYTNTSTGNSNSRIPSLPVSEVPSRPSFSHSRPTSGGGGGGIRASGPLLPPSGSGQHSHSHSHQISPSRSVKEELSLNHAAALLELEEQDSGPALCSNNESGILQALRSTSNTSLSGAQACVAGLPAIAIAVATERGTGAGTGLGIAMTAADSGISSNSRCSSSSSSSSSSSCHSRGSIAPVGSRTGSEALLTQPMRAGAELLGNDNSNGHSGSGSGHRMENDATAAAAASISNNTVTEEIARRKQERSSFMAKHRTHIVAKCQSLAIPSSTDTDTDVRVRVGTSTGFNDITIL